MLFFTFCLRFHSMSVGKLHSNKVFLTLLPFGKFATQWNNLLLKYYCALKVLLDHSNLSCLLLEHSNLSWSRSFHCNSNQLQNLRFEILQVVSLKKKLLTWMGFEPRTFLLLGGGAASDLQQSTENLSIFSNLLIQLKYLRKEKYAQTGNWTRVCRLRVRYAIH